MHDRPISPDSIDLSDAETDRSEAVLRSAQERSVLVTETSNDLSMLNSFAFGKSASAVLPDNHLEGVRSLSNQPKWTREGLLGLENVENGTFSLEQSKSSQTNGNEHEPSFAEMSRSRVIPVDEAQRCDVNSMEDGRLCSSPNVFRPTSNSSVGWTDASEVFTCSTASLSFRKRFAQDSLDLMLYIRRDRETDGSKYSDAFIELETGDAFCVSVKMFTKIVGFFLFTEHLQLIMIAVVTS